MAVLGRLGLDSGARLGELLGCPGPRWTRRARRSAFADR